MKKSSKSRSRESNLALSEDSTEPSYVIKLSNGRELISKASFDLESERVLLRDPMMLNFELDESGSVAVSLSDFLSYSDTKEAFISSTHVLSYYQSCAELDEYYFKMKVYSSLVVRDILKDSIKSASSMMDNLIRKVIDNPEEVSYYQHDELELEDSSNSRKRGSGKKKLH